MNLTEYQTNQFRTLIEGVDLFLEAASIDCLSTKPLYGIEGELNREQLGEVYDSLQSIKASVEAMESYCWAMLGVMDESDMMNYVDAMNEN